MSQQTRPQQDLDANDWKTPFCDPGEDGDCPRSCFLGFDQFGRTRYRLEELDHDGNPMDMKKYKGCNTPCWDYCLLCFGTLYIGSGVYTGRQTHRIRKKYGIPGNYSEDIAKGIFCQPCSLIRNEVEVRRREGQNYPLEQRRLPVPLGEDNFQPIFAMAVSGENHQPLYTLPINEPYRPEPRMGSQSGEQSKAGPGRREVHFHDPSQSNEGPRMVPLYPTEEDLEYLNTQLPRIPDVGSPLSLDALGRRLQALTPISEGESTEDPHHKENNPKLAQVQDWLHSAGAALADKFTTEKEVVVPGPGNPPALVQTGKASPEPSSSPKPKKKSPFGKGLKRSDKKKQVGSPEPEEELAVQDAPEIIVTSSPEPAAGIEPISKVTEQLDVRNGPRRPVAHPPALHDLATDLLVPTALVADLEHDIEDDVGVQSPESAAPREHKLSADQKAEYLKLTDPEHELSTDLKVEFLKLTDREHQLGRDRRVTISEVPFRGHNLSADKVVDVPTDDITWIQKAPGEHKLSKDIKVEMPHSLTGQHDLQSDIRVRTPDLFETEEHELSRDEMVPELLRAREHTLSKDKQVASPAPRGAFSHGIHIDERVPAPELVWATLEHDILKDRQVLSPSPGYEEHDIHADERVKSPAILPPNEHDIKSDGRVADPPGPSKQHGLQEDDTIPSSSKKPAKDHSISQDTKVAQRAYQLLEHFLEQDRKASGRSEKSR